MLSPTNDSDIRVEVWLPTSGWNGKLQAVGNGGWAGSISYTALAAAVTSGYAAAATDTGHATPGARLRLAIPSETDRLRASLAARIGGFCQSDREYVLRQRPETRAVERLFDRWQPGADDRLKYPADFDAIVAGAPPDPRARLMSVRLLINRQVHRSTDSYIPPEKYPAIHDAVLNACDTLDGAKDGVIENPRACKFDPKSLECKGADGPTCLSPAQVETTRLLYSDVKFPRTERVLYPPLLQPIRARMGNLAGPQPFTNAVDAYRLVHKDRIGRPSVSTWQQTSS